MAEQSIRILQCTVQVGANAVERDLVQLLCNVRDLHLQFVEPSKRHADIIVPNGYNVGAVGTITSMIRDVLSNRPPR